MASDCTVTCMAGRAAADSTGGAAATEPGDTSNEQHRHAHHAGGRRTFRPPDALLEPEDGPVHLRRPQQDPHHQPGSNGNRLGGHLGRGEADGGPAQQDPVRRHQALRLQGGARAGPAGGHALHRPALAGRHPHQLQDHPPIHPPPDGARYRSRGRHLRHAHQEGSAAEAAPPVQAGTQPRRHQGDGRPAGCAVRGGRASRTHRRGRGQQAQHPGDRHRGHQ